MGHGWFSENVGGARMSAGSLAVHLLYGGILGTLASYGDEQRMREARQRWVRRAA
jgi:hypothetical protein